MQWYVPWSSWVMMRLTARFVSMASHIFQPTQRCFLQPASFARVPWNIDLHLRHNYIVPPSRRICAWSRLTDLFPTISWQRRIVLVVCGVGATRQQNKVWCFGIEGKSAEVYDTHIKYNIVYNICGYEISQTLSILCEVVFSFTHNNCTNSNTN